MARPSPARSAQIVCFSHATALEILLAMPSTQRQHPVRSRSYPAQAPSLSEVCQARDRVLERIPGLSLSTPLHVTSASTSHNHRTDAVAFHRSEGSFVGTGLLSVGEGVRTTTAALSFVRAAAALPLIDLLELGFELCGTYRRGRGALPTRYGVDPLLTIRRLTDFLRRNPGMHGAKQARRALRYLVEKAESPREAKCALLFGLPRALGGYGLGMPVMGHEVACTGEAYAIAETRVLRCDLYWPSARLGMEYQSRAFHEGELHRARDSRRVNALRAMGIEVVPVTDNELESLFACDTIAQSVRQALGKRERTRVENVRERKLRLRRQLCLPLEPRRAFDLPGEGIAGEGIAGEGIPREGVSGE